MICNGGIQRRVHKYLSYSFFKYIKKRNVKTTLKSTVVL